ncbi:helix-turn-helix domain-containing protein [Gaoshiqia sediminis]|uniref:Helix-turn-helix domain-containing protein n=1 Tax=Gaoshiqia sediminis TaxID=2986998 RepID=A0AA42C974_9BACT|nr:helix-turn-helix transcriptional regulator [Gaoshiqia sediminis]MCW0482132.1 helix-turn-helix domain-containing protein [Gaoshiqia sediminis]
MNSRIKRFMEYKGLTSSELADSIGVQRSNVTHVLHGRNNPSFPFISKLLEAYPEIDAKWLIMGEGEMLVTGTKQAATLFPREEEKTKTVAAEPERLEEPLQSEKTVLPKPTMEAAPPPVEPTVIGKEVERIVVFYTDQTFKQYTPLK